MPLAVRAYDWPSAPDHQPPAVMSRRRQRYSLVSAQERDIRNEYGANALETNYIVGSAAELRDQMELASNLEMFEAEVNRFNEALRAYERVPRADLGLHSNVLSAQASGLAELVGAWQANFISAQENIQSIVRLYEAGIKSIQEAVNTAARSQMVALEKVSYTQSPVAAQGELWLHLGRIGEAECTASERWRDEVSFWRGLGEPAVHWLIDRLDEPADLGYTWRLIHLLSSLGSVSVKSIILRLEGVPSYAEAIALLDALAGIEPDVVAAYQEQISQLLRFFLRHSDDALRSHAAAATATLSQVAAVPLLRDALNQEEDADVRRSLIEELAERGVR